MSPIPNIIGSFSESLASSDAPSTQAPAAPSTAPMTIGHMLFIVAMFIGACVLASAIGYHLAPFVKGISQMLHDRSDDEEKQIRTRNSRFSSPLPEATIAMPFPTYSPHDAYRPTIAYTYHQAPPVSICPGPPPRSPLPALPHPVLNDAGPAIALPWQTYSPRDAYRPTTAYTHQAPPASICPGPPPRTPLPPLPHPVLSDVGPNTFDPEGEFTLLLPPPPRPQGSSQRVPHAPQSGAATLRAILGAVDTNIPVRPVIAPQPQEREREGDHPMWLINKTNAKIPCA